MRIALYNRHFATLGGGERRTALLAAHLARAHDVALFSQTPIDVVGLRDLFGIDISGVHNVVLPPAALEHRPLIAQWHPDLFINNSHASQMPCPATRGIYMCMFPVVAPEGLETYQVVTANSAYTKEWIAKLWGRQAEVVYSAVESMGPPATKKNIILNVARFEADMGLNHFKHQDVLLRAFGRLRPEIDASWELHFVGMVSGHRRDRTYAENLRWRTSDAGVHFHFGLPHAELRELYRSASLYWHATGCGDPDGMNPARQEHFGMTILEAMSAGAIPLAFRGGGPRETIVHGESGFLWSRPEELLEHTRHLIGNPSLRAVMSSRCIERSRRFDKDEFLRRMDAIIAGMVPV